MSRVLSLSLLLLSSIGLVAAVESPAPWRSLPQETVLAISCPDWQAFSDLFMRTKYAQALFTTDLRDGMQDMLATASGTTPDMWRESLAEWGLTPEDASGLLAGPSGMAMALYPAADRGDAPLAVGIGWIRPATDLGDRLLAALDKLLLMGEEEGAIMRREQEIDGRNLTAVVIDGQPHFFFGREGDTIAWAIALYDDEELAELGETKALQIIDGLLAGREGAFGSLIDTHPGTAAIRSPGQTMINIHAHIPPLMACLPLHESLGPVSFEQMIQALGIDALDLLSLRTSLTSDGLLHLDAFMGAAAPRRGVLALLDVDEVVLSAPAWADEDALSLASMACDLPALYNTIKDIVTTLIPDPSTRQGFLAVEMQAQMMLGAPLDAVLASFTAPMQVVSFPMDGSDAMADIAIQPTAVSWDMANPAIAQQLLQSAGMGLAMLGAQPIDEDGITGYRIPNPMGIGQLGALLFGGPDQTLVMAIGGDIEEPIRGHLSAQSGTLAQASWLASAKALLPRESGLVVAVQDYERTMRFVLPFLKNHLRTTVTQMASVGTLDLPPGIGPETLIGLIPDVEDLAGTLGVSAGTIWVEEYGLLYRAVGELPMAEE